MSTEDARALVVELKRMHDGDFWTYTEDEILVLLDRAASALLSALDERDAALGYVKSVESKLAAALTYGDSMAERYEEHYERAEKAEAEVADLKKWWGRSVRAQRRAEADLAALRAVMVQIFDHHRASPTQALGDIRKLAHAAISSVPAGDTHEHDWQARVGGGSKCTTCHEWVDKRFLTKGDPR